MPHSPNPTMPVGIQLLNSSPLMEFMKLETLVEMFSES